MGESRPVGAEGGKAMRYASSGLIELAARAARSLGPNAENSPHSHFWSWILVEDILEQLCCGHLVVDNDWRDPNDLWRILVFKNS
jgi:hypothetical protein